MELKFPLIVKNELDTWQTIGSIWLPPSSCLSISQRAYEDNEKFFRNALSCNKIVFLDEMPEGGMSDPAGAEDETIEKVQQDKSIVRKYIDGEIHWRTAQVEIEKMDDIEAIDLLLIEAQSLGLTEGVIIRSLEKRFDELAEEL